MNDRPHPSRRNAVSLFALATVAAAAPRPLSAAVEPIRVSAFLSEALCPLYYGIKTGKFEAAGIDVQVAASQSGAASMAAVVAGSYEMATPNLLSLCSAHLREIPLVMVAPEVLYTTRTREGMLQVAVDTAYRTGADLNGKIVGVPSLDGINTLAARAWVDRNGGNSATLKFVEVPNAAQPQAIAQHRIDAAVIEPPVLDASLADRTSKTIGDPMGAVASAFMISAFVTRADWATQHADLVRRFARVLTDSARYVNGHYAETAALVAEFTKIDPAVVAKMARSTAGTGLEPAQVQPLIDAAARYNLIPRQFPARELFWSGA